MMVPLSHRHRKLALALDATVLPSEWEVEVSKDWKRDVCDEQQQGLDREKFDWCWFELADVWTNSMEADAYAEFLTRILSQIAKPNKNGSDGPASVLQSDEAVIRAHFEWLRETRARFDPKNTLPICLARWRAWADSQAPPLQAPPLQGPGPRRRTRTKSLDLAELMPVVATPTPHRQGAWARPQSARMSERERWAQEVALSPRAAQTRPGTHALIGLSESVLRVGPAHAPDLVAPWVMWERNPRYNGCGVERTAMPVLPQGDFRRNSSKGPPR